MSRRPAAVALALLLTASWARGQTRGAELLKQRKPTYPEKLTKSLQQGNVILIGRLDAHGRLQDLRVGGSTLPEFIPPALDAASSWEFRPALRDGHPIEIAVNIGIRFRLDAKFRGQIGHPILGDLSVSSADASGKAIAPEGFPITRSAEARLHVEAQLDVSPDAKPRHLSVKADAVSPQGRHVNILDRSVAVDANRQEVEIVFSTPVGANWEDGVWRIRFTVDGADAGAGQFWLAGDPAHFDFATALRRLK